jgi:5-methylthioadenosine/S-adenosylhomocysteine deaminase
MRVLAVLLFVAWHLQAEHVNWIWTARYVVTMDSTRRVIEDGAVAVMGERIVGVGKRVEIERRFTATRRFDLPKSLIAPGLVNTHTHAAMSLFRGIANDMPLEDWLKKFVFPAETKNLSPEFVRWGTRLACLEMALSGTTTFTDMYYFEDVVAQATKEAGLRGVLGETIISFPSPDASRPEDALQFTEKFIKRFRNDQLIVPAVAPHALFTNSDKTLIASRALANRYGVPLLTHLAETRQERQKSESTRGMSPVCVLDSLGVFNGRTLGAHGVWLDDNDLRILKARGVGIAHCPSSNTMLASGVAPVTRMLAMGISVGLGTDGPAGTNNDFNLFEEMDLASKLQKVTTGNPKALAAQQAFEMATIQGANALGIEKETGSIEIGKRADLISVRLDAPHAVPLYHIYSQLVYSLKGCDVENVMVNGRLIVHKREMLTLDRRKVLAKAAEYGLHLVGSLQ